MLSYLIFAQKHRLWYSLEAPLHGGSNEYPQSMFCAEIKKKKKKKKNQIFFLSGNVQVLEVKFSIYLNRRVFVMNCIFFESLGNSSDSSRKQIFREILLIFSYVIIKKNVLIRQILNVPLSYIKSKRYY